MKKSGRIYERYPEQGRRIAPQNPKARVDRQRQASNNHCLPASSLIESAGHHQKNNSGLAPEHLPADVNIYVTVKPYCAPLTNLSTNVLDSVDPPDISVQNSQIRLKVLHVYRTYFPETQGGLEEAIRQICLNTQPLGIESRVLTTAWNPEPVAIQRPEALVIRAKRQIDIASCSIGFDAIQLYQEQLEWADVINLHYPWPFADILHLLSKKNKPVIVTYHSDIIRQKVMGALYSPLRKALFERSARIVATSQNYKQSSSVLQHYASKTEVIPLGLNRNTLSPAPPDIQRETLERFGQDYFLFVGVLRYYKGLHFLIDAMRDTPYNLIIAGDGPCRKALESQTKKANLQNIQFTGYVSDEAKSALIGNCRAIVFPSHLRSEAFGLTLVEGALYGKPLISCEIGTGTSFVNMHGESGLVVKPKSAAALRQAMETLWRQRETALAMGRNANARYEALFSGPRLGKHYSDLYKEVAGTHPKTGLETLTSSLPKHC